MSKGVQLIVGGRDFDAYLAEAALERVLQAAIGADRKDALQAFRGDEASWAQVLDAARTRSLFAARKAVVVRQAELLRGDESALPGYVKDPTPGVTLVLVAAKLDKRKAVWKKLFEAADVVLAEPLKRKDLKPFVRNELHRRGLELEDDAVDALIDRVGADLRRLMGEVDKLEAYAQGRRLTSDAVEELLGHGFARPLYELADAYGERRTAHALELIEQALDQGEAPLRILATLHRALRQLRAARALHAARTPREEIARRLLPPTMAFKLESLLRSARGWDQPALARATLLLDRADRGIKTGAEARSLLAAAIVGASAGGREEARASPAEAR